jgi:hypothetical protein
MLMHPVRHLRRLQLIHRRDEKGASLILALVFLVAVSLIVGALADWATNDLHNTTSFHSASSLNYAASSTVELAIQNMRTTPQAGTKFAVPGSCWTPAAGNDVSGLSNFDGYTVAVWCNTVENDQSQNTRVVTFWACMESSLNISLSLLSGVATGCETSYVLMAKVDFDDYPAGGVLPLLSTCTPPNCGYGATTEQWTWAGS